MLSMGKWEYIAAPGYLLVLILLLSIDGKGSKVRSGCRRREVSSSHCARCSSERVLLITTLYMSSESWQEKKSYKRQNNTGQRAKDDSQLRLLQWAFLAKEKNSNNNKNFAIKFPKTLTTKEKNKRITCHSFLLGLRGTGTRGVTTC